MADFVLPEKIATIELDDGDFAGAEITVRLRVPLGVLREIADMAARTTDLDTVDRLCEMFVRWSLVSWNFADHLGPIPATVEGLKERLDAATLGAVVAAWVGAVVNPPAPLSAPSSATGPSPAPRRNRKPSTSRS